MQLPVVSYMRGRGPGVCLFYYLIEVRSYSRVPSYRSILLWVFKCKVEKTHKKEKEKNKKTKKETETKSSFPLLT